MFRPKKHAGKTRPADSESPLTSRMVRAGASPKRKKSRNSGTRVAAILASSICATGFILKSEFETVRLLPEPSVRSTAVTTAAALPGLTDGSARAKLEMPAYGPLPQVRPRARPPVRTIAADPAEQPAPEPTAASQPPLADPVIAMPAPAPGADQAQIAAADPAETLQAAPAPAPEAEALAEIAPAPVVATASGDESLSEQAAGAAVDVIVQSDLGFSMAMATPSATPQRTASAATFATDVVTLAPQRKAAPADAKVAPATPQLSAAPGSATSDAPAVDVASLSRPETGMVTVSDTATAADAAPSLWDQSESCVAGVQRALNGRTIWFDEGSAGVPDAQFDELVPALRLATGCPEAVVHIEGHADPVGNRSLNLLLSLERAEAVIGRMADNQIDTQQFRAIAIGDREVQGTAAQDQTSNRRVRFIVY